MRETTSLITGITGFVGSHLADLLLAKGHGVEGLKRWRSPMENVAHIKRQVFWYNGDLLDARRVNEVMERSKPDAIYHLAAQSYVPYSFENPAVTLETNIIGTLNLLEAVRRFSPQSKVLICSSSEVYGQIKEDEVPVKETQPFRPASPYGVSKAGEDLLSQVYCRAYGLKIVIARLFTHTGPRRGEVFVVSTFAKQIVEIEKGLRSPPVYVGNLDSVRTFMDVRDAVRAYHLLIEKDTVGEIYNAGGNVTMTIREMLDKLLRLTTYRGEIRIVVLPSLLRSADVTLQIPDSSKIQTDTGWKPEIPFEKTLSDTLDYWRERV